MKKMKRQRISREVFSSLGRPQKTVSSLCVSLQRFTPPPGTEGSPFMVTVSKKEVETAVKRNLLRRRCTNILDGALRSTAKNFVLRCIVKRPAMQANFVALQKDILGLLNAL